MPDDPAPEPIVPAPVEIQRRVLEFWERERIPAQLVAGTSGGPEFRFTEGPPTANGVPHLGHLLARSLKDVHLRYRRMRGYRIVSPMAGWDCHGLPVELEVEKRHGLKSKQEIEAFGVERFCDECRTGALEVANVWREMSRRLGYWLDYDHPYYTMDANYIESVWWSLRSLFDGGLLSKGYYVLPYCPRCETPLASHEVAQGYHTTTDPSIVVRFRLRGPEGSPIRYLLVWTTTPWTLPANLLVAVRSDLDYVAVPLPDGSEGLLAEAALPRYFPNARVLQRWKGTELLGSSYEPLFPFAGEGAGRYRVVADEMVQATEGTGFVHIAPSFGPDDQRIGAREGVGMFDPLDRRGVFTDKVAPVAGRFFKAADRVLLGRLRESGALVAEGTIQHTYPFCWRCATPLLYRAIDSWFVTTSKRTEPLVADNRTVRWIPEHLRDGRFGNFLTEAKDWALSRNRYWGTPLPIWVCPNGHAHCVGSFAELAERVGSPLPVPFDPHRVMVDRLEFPCPTCGATARREPYTIDAWYDSGSAPFAQYHYPFEPGPFRPEVPLDFVAEGLDQTRGWFYTLLVIAELLFERPAYRVSIANGLVLDETGQKMSKSRPNAIDPLSLLDRQGGDAVRWTILISDYTDALRLSETTVQPTGARTIGILTNVARFHLENARADRLRSATERPRPTALLDRWILSRLDGVTTGVGQALEEYDPRKGAHVLHEFVDDLSTWYLRRSRPRFWEDAGAPDRLTAHATLSWVLLTLARLFAPYTPFTAEYLHQELLDRPFPEAGPSVHALPWPTEGPDRDEELEGAMSSLREWVEVGREMRQRAQVKSRIPLPTLVLDGDRARALVALGAEGRRLFEEELNVRSVEWRSELSKVDFPDSDWVTRETDGAVIAALARRPTPELLQEGLRREVLRRLQVARKEHRFRPTDRIRLRLWAPPPLFDPLSAGRAELARALLADSLELEAAPPPSEPGLDLWELDGVTLGARVERAV